MTSNKKKILIVGCGAAGVAAAYALGQHPEKFEVTIWDKNSLAGGVATSEHIDGNSIFFLFMLIFN